MPQNEFGQFFLDIIRYKYVSKFLLYQKLRNSNSFLLKSIMADLRINLRKYNDTILRVEECHGDLLYMNCAFNLASCDDKIANVSCSQGCGCPYDKPYYNTEEHRCQSFSDFCRVRFCILHLKVRQSSVN